MSDNPIELRKALEDLLPYARSRLEDMHENAEETHGEGKAYRCACYRRGQARMEAALAALGMKAEFRAEATWGAQMRQAVVNDCGRPKGSCSWDGAKCLAPAEDLPQILAIPGAVEALAMAGTN